VIYTWNPDKRRYEKDGKPVPPDDVRKYIETYIDANKSELDAESESLLLRMATGVLISRFFDKFRERIKDMHGTAGVIAYGGEDQMSPERWGRIGDKISREYEYLNDFEQAVEESRKATDDIVRAVVRQTSAPAKVVEKAVLVNPPSQVAAVVTKVVEKPVVIPEPLFDKLIWGEVGSRSRLYADSVYSTHENSVKAREQDAGVLSGRRVHEGDSSVCEDCKNAASEEYVPLGDLLDIGDSICHSNCRCTIEFDYHGIEPLVIDRSAYVG
jgi:hypothetical protein